MAGQRERSLTGERDLSRLLASLAPRLANARYGFVLAEGVADDAFAIIREAEGTTHIRPEADGGWARISLSVHSSLEAVGLTATLSAALAGAGISANIVAGFHHDHVFVPWDRRHEALELLERLAAQARRAFGTAP